MKLRRKLAAFAASAAVAALAVSAPFAGTEAAAVSAGTTINDMPSAYVTGADWIWNNRIMNEDSLGVKSKRWNTLFDQIIANKGQLNYVVRWHSMQQISYDQRKSFEAMVETGINNWTDWLVGYENWPYDHVKVNIIGWAVLDKSCLTDLHSDEVVWDNISEAEGDTALVSKGVPSQIPCAPPELWTFNYFRDRSHVYPGQSFDMYLWATQNYGDYGGCGGDWGQRLSDNFYLAAASGSGFPHIYWHELGHGFGMTDFYGGEGESDGFPPGGFPGGENSIMMAGSCSYINDFDGWMLRYMWSKISTDTARFDLANAVDPNAAVTTTTTTAQTTTTTAAQTTTTTVSSADTTAPRDTGTLPEYTVPAVYDAENNYWLVDVNGESSFKLQASGAPWAGVSGQYGYWDTIRQEWIRGEFMYENSLGETGTATIDIDLAGGAADQLQIQVFYYAAWDNAVQDMVALDQSGLTFSAILPNRTGTTEPTAELTTTTTSTTITTTTTVSEDSALTVTMRGDANCDGKVTVADAVMVSRVSAEDPNAGISEQGKLNGDVDGAAGLSANDAVLILKFIAGLQQL